MLDLGAKEATLVVDGIETRVPAASLAVNDLFLVRPGERITTDGIIIDGFGAIDASMITGESVPIDAAAGDQVIGGTINHGGRLLVRATRSARRRSSPGWRNWSRMLNPARPTCNGSPIGWRPSSYPWCRPGGPGLRWLDGARSRVRRRPHRRDLGAHRGVPVRARAGDADRAAGGDRPGCQLGILIKGPQVLESTRRIDTVVLDKTGTVTTGAMTLIEVITLESSGFGVSADAGDAAFGDGSAGAGELGGVGVGGSVEVRGVSRDRLLALAGAVGQASEHPIAHAIAASAAELGPLLSVTGFEALPGLGARGIVDGIEVIVGARLLESRGVPVLAALLGGHTVLVAVDGRAVGALVVADSPKPDAAAAIARLRSLGLRPILLTGDSLGVARDVADRVGIDEVIAEVMPADKVATVRRLQSEGRVVAMVGDGVNDARARHRRSRASRSAPGRMWRSRRRSDAGPRGSPRVPTRSGWPGPPCGRSRPTCSGRSPTTWRRSRWPRGPGHADGRRLRRWRYRVVFVVTNSLRLFGFRP